MATQAERRTDNPASALLLKVTPPRVPRDLLVRARLRSDDPKFRERPVIVLQAPAGFGKTALLAQWRREFLAHGSVVAWFASQEDDDPQRFVRSLALAVRLGSGRQTFGHALIESVPAGLEGITAWLAEVAQSALDVILMIDEADRLPGPSRKALTYLLHNTPANLRVVVAARPERDLGVGDLVPYGQCEMIGASTLRFQLDETLALIGDRFSQRADADSAARLHELTEGWPLGLQLALSAVAHSADPRATINAITTRSGQLHDHLVNALFAKLDPDDAEFLTRIAIVDDLHADLCSAMTGMVDAAERLARLARETPLLVASEGSDWLRMHMVARDALRQRFAKLRPVVRSELHSRASAWLAGQGMLEQAAQHALDAGQRQQAYDLAERCLYENVLTRGRLGAVLDWLGRLPGAELDRRPRLLLAAAWALAISERHAEAQAMVERILAHSGSDAAMRCECALILSAAAGYADDPDRFAELHDPWAESPPLTDPQLLYVHANRKAFRALFEGNPAQARHCQQQAPRGDFGDAFRHLALRGEYITALSYLWEGQVLLTESLLRPALASAEEDLGRRDPFVCMLAALLAAAVWERDQPREAAAFLANRLDVLERSGLPDAVMLGFRTVARIAAAEGAEHRTLEYLEAMHAVGLGRNLPRIAVASLADQIRMHARRYRAETCRELCERLDAFLSRKDVPSGKLWRRSVDWMHQLAHANAAIAAQDWRNALDALARAGTAAEAMGLGRVRIEVMALRAFALDHCGEKSVALLREAIDLAKTYGLARLFVDAHPAVGDWAQRVVAEESGAADVRGVPAVGAVRPLAAPMRPLRPQESRATPSMALTPKEREVLELLARNLSNKEIARAMQIGEETIKWHLKNLFGKLNAGSRDHLLHRARMVGILDTVA